MSIPFTQYLLPDGQQKPITIDRPREIEDLAKKLVEDGCVFEIEMLRTGDISMTCERDEYVMVHEVCSNGPAVPENVDRMILAASTVTFSESWCPECDRLTCHANQGAFVVECCECGEPSEVPAKG